MYNHKIIVFIGMILFLGITLCFAQEESEESITITTYYPSPYGVYNELRLYPNTSPSTCDADNEGAMYYDDTSNQTKVCRQIGSSPDTYAWESVGGGLPSGVILMWSGSLASIPVGWALCDGTNGTPDLRDKFIMGVPPGEDPGATGGASTHLHAVGTLATAADGTHQHELPIGRNFVSGTAYPLISSTAPWGSGSSGSLYYLKTKFGGDDVVHFAPVTKPFWLSRASTTHIHSISGSTALQDHRPPYYKLAFIMKL